MDITGFVAINCDTIAFENGDAVGFININSGQTDFHYILSEKPDPITGISCIAANQIESIFALGCISIVPYISLHSFPDVCCIASLKSKMFDKKFASKIISKKLLI